MPRALRICSLHGRRNSHFPLCSQCSLSYTVFKTKAATEAAKRLEGGLEDAFGSANTRDFRGQKKGGGGRAGPPAANRKTNQQKTDQRRSARLKLEKQLQTNMESFVTRRCVLVCYLKYSVLGVLEGDFFY